MPSNQSFRNGLNFFCLSLLAFAGFGLEIILAFVLEPFFYGRGLNDFSTAENILHWVMTCLLWAGLSYLLIHIAKKKYAFDIFAFRNSMGLGGWLICLGLLTVSVVVSVMSWQGIKVVKELMYNGWLKFMFQYIYYFVETGLFLLIIVFGQKAGELWFRERQVPWGGLLVGLTWGLVHAFTKGDVLVGALSCLSGLMYGVVYLICKKNLYFAYPLIFLMFAL